MTATQHALLLPEIRRSIIEWAREEPYHYDNIDTEHDVDIPRTREYTLLCCGLVNKTWYHEAMPVLWNDLDPLCYWHTLPYFSRCITPDRRQFYADFVKHALLHTAMDDNDDNNEILKGLAFPNLRSLRLFVGVGHRYIPRIQGHRIEKLDVVPYHHVFPIVTVGAEDMNEILEQIPLIEGKAVFPDLTKLVFVDLAPVYRESPQRLAARLPRLETYDHRYLSEVEER
ncbi:hypothetical protein CNMCM5793_006789 [Aspergillus hiratsukae]|uniref:F-box domain-containing protein n=1 Tax=Aspergillus hiratsukae TaxID=1194566 RepID=A0A8H6UDD9_9EURO|nr:hypothetical protein CNMCM5793_006789 [Aspergillus hiratsukae]